MSTIKITIPGRYQGLNEYVFANRASPYAGRTMKHKSEKQIKKELAGQLDRPLLYPVWLDYCFYELNKRRDKSNIAGYFHKVFEDSLVQCGFLKDDGWKYVEGFSDAFKVDHENPRIEVTITEYGDGPDSE